MRLTSGTVPSSARHVRAIRRISTYVFFVVVPVLWITMMLINWIGSKKTGFDLVYAFLPAAHHVLHGASPYPAPGDPAIVHQVAYVYPPVVAYAVTPLTILPTAVAVKIAVVGSMLVAVLILAACGVRDWRCYTTALLWSPVANSVRELAISLPLALLVALGWRLRRREARSGALIGLTIAAKVFMWPLLAWPVALGKGRAALTAVVTAVFLALGSWAAIGFAGLTSYGQLLHHVTSLEERNSYSISGSLRVLGVGTPSARCLALAVAAVFLVACYAFGRQGDETRSLTAAILSSLALTPILWQHYLVLLLVVVGIARPRFSAVWLAPIVLWLSPYTGNGTLVQTLLVPVVAFGVGIVCLMPGDGQAGVEPLMAAEPPCESRATIVLGGGVEP